MTARLGTRLSWAGCGLSVLCGVVGALALFPNRKVTPVPELLLIAGALAYSGVGALIVMRQPANRIGWLLLLTGVLSSVCVAASGYASFSLVIAGRCHANGARSEEHTSELQSHLNLVCRLLLEKKKKHNS